MTINPEAPGWLRLLLAHGSKLQGGLLVMGRDSRVEPGPHDPLAKNPSGNGPLKTLILRGF